MKIVINADFGGFGYSQEFLDFFPDGATAERDDLSLIAALEEFGLEKAGGGAADLEIIEIPDEATDWTVTEYDGQENIIYVVDGKIHFA